MPTPQLLLNTAATSRLKNGFDKLAKLLALTLGPSQGTVMMPSALHGKPEILSDAATIARRVLQLPDRAEDVGAMILRNLVWRMNQRAGDGAALASVLAQAILDQAHRVIIAGANPMLLRRGIDRAARAAIDALQAQARPVRDAEDLALVAYAITGEAQLSNVLGAIYWELGPNAFVTIEDYMGPYLAGERLEGGRWVGRMASPYFITDAGRQRAIHVGGPVALFAGTVSDVDAIQPLLEMIAQTEDKTGVLIAQDIQGAALATLAMNYQQGTVKVLGIELRNSEIKRRADFEDLAVLTGAAVLSPDLGQSIRRVTHHDLGTARQVEADAEEVIVVGDGHRAAAIQRQSAILQTRLDRLPETDEGREELRQRLARLNSQTAVLKIGAYTEAERTVLRQRAEKGLRALPSALREGIALGGGVAYLNCIEAVNGIEAEGDEAFGVAVMARALEEPFRRIAANAGAAAPSAALAEVRRLGPEYGYDAEYNEIVSMAEEDILDSVGVLRQALETAVSGAIMALTIDAIILHRKPQQQYEP